MFRMRDKSLLKEIVQVLGVKLVLLIALWFAFFSQPVDENITERDIHDLLIGQLAQQFPETPEKPNGGEPQ